jgi:hypothetical protein
VAIQGWRGLGRLKVVPFRREESLRQLLEAFVLPGHFSIRPDSPCRQPMEQEQPPPLDSAASPPELHSTQIALRLAKARQ